ncbi:MAG TPA: DUF4388 domain-containing protein [Candidatus Polarisedimenticolaceae bacterium]|nr:DUF4388 domain-containing protein [Candidatus Polarisedimenticolaceae bacterium]
MALQGTLRDFGLADIFQLIGMQRKTGTLTLRNERETVYVKFHEGAVVGGESATQMLEDLLGSVLVRTGRITDAQLQEALRLQGKTLQRLGYLLVKNGFISPHDLQDALHTQVTQVVYRLFRWRSGTYHFQADEAIDYDHEFTPVSAETILMEGARMVDEWPILERRIRSTDMVFRQTAAGRALDAPLRSLVDAPSPPSEQDEAHVSPDELQILHLVDGKRRVQDVVERSSLGEFDAYRMLYELLNRNFIEEVTLADAPVQAAAGVLGPSLLPRVLLGLLAAAALVSLLTLHLNPLTPWQLSGAGTQTERLKTFASRGRLERIARSLEVFYLDTGSLPPRLDLLAGAGYLSAADLLDPWGRPYAYQLAAQGYGVAGRTPAGAISEALTLTHRFSAAQRMVLEGGVVPDP